MAQRLDMRDLVDDNGLDELLERAIVDYEANNGGEHPEPDLTIIMSVIATDGLRVRSFVRAKKLTKAERSTTDLRDAVIGLYLAKGNLKDEVFDVSCHVIDAECRVGMATIGSIDPMDYMVRDSSDTPEGEMSATSV